MSGYRKLKKTIKKYIIECNAVLEKLLKESEKRNEIIKIKMDELSGMSAYSINESQKSEKIIKILNDLEDSK